MQSPIDPAASMTNLENHLEHVANAILPDVIEEKPEPATLEQVADHMIKHIQQEQQRLQDLERQSLRLC